MTINLKSLNTLKTSELIKLDSNTEETNPEKREILRKRIRHIIYKRYEKYVYKFAHNLKYPHSNEIYKAGPKQSSSYMRYQHICSSARFALIDAINDYDPSKGASFSTWAYNRIKFAAWGCLKELKGIPLYYKAIGRSDGKSVNGTTFQVVDENLENERKRFTLTTGERERLNEIVEEVFKNPKHFDKYLVVVARFGLHGNDEPMSNQQCCEEFGMTPPRVSSAVRFFIDNAKKKYGKELESMYVLH